MKKISRVVVDGPCANSVFISGLLDTAIVYLPGQYLTVPSGSQWSAWFVNPKTCRMNCD